MEELLEENDRLKEEVERLTQTLESVSDGLGRSVDLWQEWYFEVLSSRKERGYSFADRPFPPQVFRA